MLTYQLLLSWAPSYQGQITLDLVPATRSTSPVVQLDQSCSCSAYMERDHQQVVFGVPRRATAACAQAEISSRNVQGCPAILPVSFMVTASVPVTAVAYKILTA